MTYLRLHCIAALLAQIHKVHHRAPQMRQSRDGLHLNRVHLLERVIQDTGGVYDLPSKVFVVHMSDKERFSGEGVL